MPTPVDSISITLTADASSAEESINKLIGRLALLKVAVQSASNFTKISAGIKRIADAAKQIDTDSGKKLSDLARGLMDLSKVGDLSNLADAGKNLSSVVRAVNSIGQTGGKGLSGLADGIKQTSDAMGSIKDADVSKLGAVRDALSGEMSGSLHSSSRTSESAALGGMGAPEPSFGNMATYGAMTVFSYVADSIRDATAAYQEFQGAIGGGSQQVFSQFTDGAMTVFKYTADSIRDATAAYREFQAALGSGVPPIFTEFADSAAQAGESVRMLEGTVGGGQQGHWEADEIRDAARAYDDLGNSAAQAADVIETWFADPPIDDSVAERVDNVTGAFWGLESALRPVIGSLGEIANGMIAIPKYFGGQLIGNIQHAVKGLTSFFNSIVRIAKYRMIRAALRMITQGINQGMKNLYAFSQAAGGTFAASMNQIATASQYMGNSFAAMAGPLVEALAPAIDFIVDKFVDMFNTISQIIARLTGASTYTAARKVASTWGGAAKSAGKSAKDAADEIKRSLMGFDEINKLNDIADSASGGGGGGGGGGGAGAMFEELPIDSEIASFADALKEAFLAGDWQELGTLLGNKVNELVDSIDWAGAGATVGYYINGWFSTQYWTLDTINFTNIGSKIAEFLNNAIAKIDFGIIGGLLVQKMTIIGDMAIGFFTDFDWGQAAEKLSDFVEGLFDEITKWLDKYDWAEIGATLAEKIFDFTTNFDTAGIADSVCSFLTSAINAGIALVTSFAINLVIEPIVTNVSKIVNAIMGEGDVDWKDISAILKSLAFGTSMFLAATGNYSGAIVALGVALMIEPIVNSIAEIVNKLKDDGGIAWDRIAGIVKILSTSAGLFLLANGHPAAGVVALGVALSIEPIVNGITDIVNKLQSDGGIAWDRVAGIVKILAANAGLFLLTSGHTAAGIVALGVALSIEPIVNGITDIVNKLQADGGIAWDRVAGIVKILAANAGIFLLASGNTAAGVVALGIALQIEPIVNGITDIVNKIQSDGGIAWDRVAGIVRILAANAGIFLLASGHPIAGVVALGIALSIEPIVNGITDIVNKIQADGGISWDRIAGIVKILASTSGLFLLLTNINPAAGVVALGVALSIQPVVNEITDIVNDVKENGITWDNLSRIISDALIGLGGIVAVTGNPVGGLLVLTIGVSLKLQIIDMLLEGGGEPSGPAWGDTPEVQLPVGLELEDGSVENLAGIVTTGWDGLPSDIKTLTEGVTPVIDDTGWEQEWDEFLGHPFEIPAEIDPQNTPGEAFGANSILNFLGKLSKADKNQTPGNVFNVGTALRFIANLTGTGSNWKAKGGIAAWLGSKVSLILNLAKTGSNWFLKGGIASWLGSKATLILNLAQKGSNWKEKGSIAAWLGSTVKLVLNLIKTGSNWMTRGGLAEWLGGAVSLIANLKKKGSNWDNAGSITKWLDGAASIIANLTTKNSNWKNAGGVTKWLDLTASIVADLTSSGSNWKASGGISKWIGGGEDPKINVVAELDSKSAAAIRAAATKAMKGISVTVKAKSSGNGNASIEVPASTGGVIANGVFRRFASGGVISGNTARNLASVPHYAGGIVNAHGTVFVAGEAGPEILGHINGRTEILNQSQLAQTMFAAVRAAMSGVQIAATMYDGGGNTEDDYEMMYRAMYDAFTDALSGSEQRDREKLALMREIAAKEFTTEVTADSVNKAQLRQNRRAGITIAPVTT